MANSADRLHPAETFIPTQHVGVLLQEARLRLGWDLRIVADDLRIKYHHLLAIEEGRFDDLPGPTYVIGFIRAYAEHLGLNAEEVVRRYKDEVQGPREGTQLDFPTAANDGGMPAGAFVVVGLLLAGVAYGTWYWLSSTDRSLADLIREVPGQLVALVDGAGDDTTAPQGEGVSGEDSAADERPGAAGTAAGTGPDTDGPRPADTADTGESGSAPDPRPGAVGGLAALNPMTPDEGASDAGADEARGSTDADAGAEPGLDADGQAPQPDAADIADTPDSDPAAPAEPLPTVVPGTSDPLPPPRPDPEEVARAQGAAGESAAPPVAAEEEAGATTPEGRGEAIGDAPGDGPSDAAEGPDDAGEGSTEGAAGAAAESASDPVPEADARAEPEVAPDPEPESAAAGSDAAESAGDADAEPATDPDAAGADAPEGAAATEEPEPPEDTEEGREETQEEAEEDAEEAVPAYVGRGAPADVRAAGGDGVRIVLRANQDAWIQVRRGGDLVVRRLLRRGDTYAVPPGRGHTLNTSNAGGLEVYVDGRRVRNLGPVGAPRNGVRLSPGALN